MEIEISEDTVIRIPKSKRVFDVLFSFVLIIICLPLSLLILFFLIIEQLIRLNAPMLFYVEKRVSKGKPFNFVKFNIFKPRVIKEYRKNGQFIFTKLLEHDGKSTTRAGHLVQKAYLDELPQFFIILMGKMSFVGPRPRDLKQYERGIKNNDFTRTVIKAGLTGKYQSHKGEPGFNQYKSDMEYIKFLQTHNSWQIFMNDIKIIGRTFVVLAKAQGY